MRIARMTGRGGGELGETRKRTHQAARSRTSCPWPPNRATAGAPACDGTRGLPAKTLAGMVAAGRVPPHYPKRRERRLRRSLKEGPTILPNPGDVARACYRAYADKNRDAIKALIAPDFHFTSPLDNRLDRDTYFARCWPNSAMLAGVDCVDVVVHGEHIFVVYGAETRGGRRFRNAERLRVHDGRIVEAEVYFG
ncbi:SnoaL-like domain [Burkholderia cepacia]|nr:snoaL-like domain protein [Burkholderia cepacia ATCC 25416]SPU76077.1 SnoaL-like domain [Burkholderia cepacia]